MGEPMDRTSRRWPLSATNQSAGKYKRRSIQEKGRVHHFRSSFAEAFVRSIDASNARSATREKLLHSAESCLLASAPRGRQYDGNRFTIRRSNAIREYQTKHPHPARRRVPQNFRSSQADGSASVLLAATLALAASGVPAGCGFQLVAEFAEFGPTCKFSYGVGGAVWTNTSRI